MNRNVIIAIIVIILIAIVGVFVFSQQPQTTADGKLNTQINILSQSTLKNGDHIEFELKNAQGKAIVGEKVNITYNNEKYSVITDKDGKGYLVINGEQAGKYDVTIDYAGNSKYNACSAKVTVTIEDGDSTTNSSTDTNSTANTVKYNNATGSSQSASSTLYYDADLNVQYDSNGIVQGGQSDGSRIQDLRDQYNNPDMIDENGNLQ